MCRRRRRVALMAMAQALVEHMQAGAYAMAADDLKPLNDAVAKVVTTRSDGRELSAEAKAAASAGGGLPGLPGLPGLFKLLVSFTASANCDWRGCVPRGCR